jgi:hypothetical protein
VIIPALIVLGGFWWFAKDKATVAASAAADGPPLHSGFDSLEEIVRLRDAWRACQTRTDAHADAYKPVSERSSEYWRLKSDETLAETSYKNILWEFGRRL